MDRAVIIVEDLSKQYRLGVINHGMLYKDLKSWWAQRRGREDPYSRIDEAEKSRNARGVDGDRFWALKDIGFEVREGERLGIIGQNGAGKSTLLKILSRVTAPTTGQIRIKGRVASLLEVGTGFHPELTGRENVYLNGAILGMKKAEISAKLDEIVAFAEVERFVDTPVKRYSSGMHVRLAFAVAAHLEPEILIVDEVLAVGDAAFQRKCLGKMKDVSTNEGRTVLFVSHNMGVILQLCERAILLEQGRMIANDRSTLVVPAYLSASQTIESEATFDIARGRDAQITSVHLVDDRSRANVRTWPHTRPFSIVISYIVSRWPKGAYVCVDVFNEQDARLIWSSDVNDVDEMLRSRKPGTYEASIEVPAMVLAPGRYFFTVAIYHPGAKAVIDAKRKAIAIDITDGGSLASKIGIMPGSLTSVPLSWKTRRREHHA